MGGQTGALRVPAYMNVTPAQLPYGIELALSAPRLVKPLPPPGRQVETMIQQEHAQRKIGSRTLGEWPAKRGLYLFGVD